ncbi:MAG: butyrate kinase [Candidatus Marinimicrobia bacterium]|nr:butyrate kinase [Candidatus Neomarinimicrobiota bacterium]MBT3496036.1 butyrate kinase [Candidatus Neomarinimicrobiota bacterium]MBT3691745.1 butyrate kinase [Candidatus Neomarinimicrobiota bacterium]MBT3732680.1 butyrate kinase [Candidatus Neomarinimicrobiota bacterium]MBT4144265.1 butyrate kinase [Candidatus Neomarinimicrobiota bacterium]
MYRRYPLFFSRRTTRLKDNIFFILTINPGSTSTEFGVFENTNCLWKKVIEHNTEESSKPLINQLSSRLSTLTEFLPKEPKIDAIAARGGPLKPLVGGAYLVNDTMVNDYQNGSYSNHASNLGALMAFKIANQFKIPAYIVDPVTTDEFIPEARISGVPGITRKSRSHALNIKFCVRKASEELNINAKQSQFVVAHLGSGFSIAAVKHTKIIDVNDALLGMGPFSIERAGALPLSGILDFVFTDNKSKEELEYIFSKKSGFSGLLGNRDLRSVEKRLNESEVKNIYQAMIYQIAKEIGSAYAVLDGAVDGLILTGGLTHSNIFCDALRKKTSFIQQAMIYPGSFELEALVAGVLPILNQKEKAKIYK